jgi:NitT/TauT family transport system substrate-binding protein
MISTTDDRKVRPPRRKFLADTSMWALASTLGLPQMAVAEPPPETTRIRLVKVPAYCLAPEYLAEELLRLEGFSEIEYVAINRPAAPEMLLADRADISAHTPAAAMADLDAGRPFVVLAGLHHGCYELVANEPIRRVRDLKGRRVGVSAMGGLEYYFIASMVAYVGMDPRKDIEWVDMDGYERVMPSFLEKKVDAILAFGGEPDYLRANNIGRTLLSTTDDRPWEQYFCCMVASRQDFVAKHPIATKRALRAILKAADLCARKPELAARLIVEKGYESDYQAALKLLKALSYTRWRTFNPEDSLRFYGIRLYDVGMIKTSPNKLIAQGSNWRFVNELKRELKA